MDGDGAGSSAGRARTAGSRLQHIRRGFACAHQLGATQPPSSLRKRVILAGIFHETHSFLDELTTLSDCDIEVGDEMLQHRGDASPLAGVLDVADRCNWSLRPVVDIRATPSGLCADEVLWELWRHLEPAAREEKDGLDGVFLVLHGAMCSVSFPDTEEEIVRRLRTVLGNDVPICGVLDLHGNISQQTIKQTDGLIAYRKNPHTDAKDASTRGAKLLDRIMSSGQRPRCVYRKVPVVWPPTGVGTADEPMRTLEAMARQAEAAHADTLAHLSVMAGFGYGDCASTGVSFHASTFGDDADVREVESVMSTMAEHTLQHRAAGNVIEPRIESIFVDIKAAVAKPNREGPVLLIEPSDNIGGGAPGDGTTLLRFLLEADPQKTGGWRDAAVCINDAGAVASLASVDIGGTASITLGGRGSALSDPPLEGLAVELLGRSDGAFELVRGLSLPLPPCCAAETIAD